MAEVKVRAVRPGDGAGCARAWLDAARYYVELDPDNFQLPAEAGLAGWFEQDHADGSQKALGALPILLVPVHAPLQLRELAAASIAHQRGHLGFERAQVAQHLRFEFIHHSHPRTPFRSQRSKPVLTRSAED